MNRINIICLGVKDMAASIRFYRDGLGFQTKEEGKNPAVLFFDTPGTKFELYPLQKLAEDINAENPPAPGSGFAGITLAYNVKSREEVHSIIQLARDAGADILKQPQDVFWGGYHAYFADPDGYCWEVAWNPFAEFDGQDHLIL